MMAMLAVVALVMVATVTSRFDVEVKRQEPGREIAFRATVTDAVTDSHDPEGFEDACAEVMESAALAMNLEDTFTIQDPATVQVAQVDVAKMLDEAEQRVGMANARPKEVENDGA